MDIDLLDPTLFYDGQPYQLYRALRETDPVHWQDNPADSASGGYWALMRHADIKAVETDSETYSSEPNTVINDDNVIGDETHKHLIFSDPPHHTDHRKLLSTEFAAPQVRSGQVQMDALVNEVIDRVIEKGECDLVDDLAGRMASYVIADLMGLPREESLELFEAAAVLTRGGSTLEGPGAQALQTVYQHGTNAWQDVDAGNGILRRISAAQILGTPMDELQFQMDFQLLISAGSDTSRNLVATGMTRLFEHPDQHRALVEDPSRVPQAVEEMLRWDPPIVYQRRTATRDAEIGGKQIRKGQKVVAYYGAGNRDPEVFTDPETFDISRTTNPHLTFGAGRHFCLGSHLARQELVAMFTALMIRMPDLRPTAPTTWYRYPDAPAVVGPTSMPVTFTPGRQLGSGMLD
jgi:cytochrome P450